MLKTGFHCCQTIGQVDSKSRRRLHYPFCRHHSKKEVFYHLRWGQRSVFVDQWFVFRLSKNRFSQNHHRSLLLRSPADRRWCSTTSTWAVTAVISSTSSTVNMNLPKAKKQRPKKKGVTCSKGKCILLFPACTRRNRGQIAHLHHEAQHVHKNKTTPTKQALVQFTEDDEGEAPKEPTREELSLPKTLVPQWYKVSLDITSAEKLASKSADGVLLMKIKAEESTDKIILNAKDIKFPKNLDKIQISQANHEIPKREANESLSTGLEAKDFEEQQPELKDSGIHVKSIDVDEVLEKATIQLDGKLEKGQEFVVKIPFNAQLNGTNGLHIFDYQVNNETRTILATRPRFAYLRHVFPSFDEESFAAPTKFSFIHDEKSNIIANVDLESKEENRTSLQPTIAPDFVVGQLERKDAQTSSGVKVTIWSREETNRWNQTNFALNYALEAIDALEHILQSRMPTKELDIVAIPNMGVGDRVSEGLIILPESRLAFDETNGDFLSKAAVAKVLANRIAAQWFGGVTNPTEFGAFWLNHALPKYLENSVLERTFELNADDIWRLETEKVMERDSRANSQPLKNHNIFSSAQLGNVDHWLSANKGAAVLRMLCQAVGEDTSKKAIRSFVASRRTSQPYDDSLWSAFQKVLPKNLKSWDGKPLDVAKFVDTWANQMGFPVINVRRLDENNIELTQERFKTDNLTPEQWKFRNARYWYNWEIPVTAEVNGKPTGLKWLHEAYRMPLNESDRLVLNPDGVGFYRVNYEAPMWRDLVKQLREDNTQLKTPAKARLVSDAFALAFAGKIPYETALNISQYLPKESDALPWAIGAEQLGNLARLVEDSSLEDKTYKFITDKTTPKFQSLKYNNDDDKDFADGALLTKLAQVQCDIEPRSCNEKFGDIFQSDFFQNCVPDVTMSSECSRVPMSVRNVVYCNGVGYADDNMFDRFLRLSQIETDPSEKERLFVSLACSRDPRLLKRALRKALNGTNERDLVTLLREMNSQPVGFEVAANFVIDNWKIIKNRFEDDPEALNDIVGAAVELNNERQRDTIGHFVERHRKSTANVGILRKKLEEVTTKIHWRKMFGDDVEQYLDGRMKPLEVVEDDDE
ncbi:unnamed protein product [Caenorhabditis auriculariae]|uniref:Aminopeptidase n=1 Tax=Caenorhabditis auriculariae TaxID=2777116 RepID=A0A8S1GV37_9PELO|nr:unnamed protein product [Caenorhabditis auriculariae]